MMPPREETVVPSPPNAAIKNNEQGVQPSHTAAAPRPALADCDWDHLRVFLSVARLGSLRAAADAEKLSVNTVRARIAALEAACGATLLRRTRDGSALTDAGAEVRRIADEMRAAATASPGPSGNVLVNPGEVRIACSEGLGLLWLTPRLAPLSEALPGLTVNLRLDYDLSKDRTREADVVLTFARPRDPDMIITRLATLHYMMFSSDAYLRAVGMPASLDDMKALRLVEQVTPGVNSWLLDHVLGTDRPDGSVPIRTNSSLSQLWAVANGAGIAPMPTFVRAITRSVIPLDPPLNLRFDLFCTYHASGRGSPAIERAVEWLRTCFDPADHPWFRSEFVHPDAFPGADRRARVVSLFDNLIDPRAGAGLR